MQTCSKRNAWIDDKDPYVNFDVFALALSISPGAASTRSALGYSWLIVIRTEE